MITHNSHYYRSQWLQQC